MTVVKKSKLIEFFEGKIIFPQNVRRHITWFMLVVLFISSIICFMESFKESLSFFTINIILMPVLFQFSYMLKASLVNKGSKNKKKFKIQPKRWILFIAKFTILVLIYFWISIVLMIALMGVVG